MSLNKSEFDGWLPNAERHPSLHYDQREVNRAFRFEEIDLLVIHNISLPPARCEADFANNNVEAFFCGDLNLELHPIFAELDGVRVSSHLYIRRDGTLVQFVSLFDRAWHAGVSCFQGREKCNDFSIGIELQGTDTLPYTQMQYQSLVSVTKQIQSYFPNIDVDNIVGHQDIAPGRKTDPGPSFDWKFYKKQLSF